MGRPHGPSFAAPVLENNTEEFYDLGVGSDFLNKTPPKNMNHKRLIKFLNSISEKTALSQTAIHSLKQDIHDI